MVTRNIWYNIRTLPINSNDNQVIKLNSHHLLFECYPTPVFFRKDKPFYGHVLTCILYMCQQCVISTTTMDNMEAP